MEFVEIGTTSPLLFRNDTNTLSGLESTVILQLLEELLFQWQALLKEAGASKKLNLLIKSVA